MQGPSLVLDPSMAAKVKVVGLLIIRIMAPFCDEKSPLHQHNANYSHFSHNFTASLLRFGQETTMKYVGHL